MVSVIRFKDFNPLKYKDFRAFRVSTLIRDSNLYKSRELLAFCVSTLIRIWGKRKKRKRKRKRKTMSAVGIEMYNNMSSMSAPSSPGRFFYSRHGSPSRQLGQPQMSGEENPIGNFSPEFEFGALRIDSEEPVVSADELFFNGRIRPMAAQNMSETESSEGSNGGEGNRGRGLQKVVSQRRRTRSLSPLRNPFLQEPSSDASKLEDIEEHKALNVAKKGRSGSKRWSLKDFLYRSKSEGSGQTQHKHWTLSFTSSPSKQQNSSSNKAPSSSSSSTRKHGEKSKEVKSKNGSDLSYGNQGKRQGKVAVSAHELHYNAKRAQAEGQRHKTFLPYRQSLFGFVGFTS